MTTALTVFVKVTKPGFEGLYEERGAFPRGRFWAHAKTGAEVSDTTMARWDAEGFVEGYPAVIDAREAKRRRAYGEALKSGEVFEARAGSGLNVEVVGVGPSVSGLIWKVDRMSPPIDPVVEVVIRGEMTSDGSDWGVGRGRVMATRIRGRWMRDFTERAGRSSFAGAGEEWILRLEEASGGGSFVISEELRRLASEVPEGVLRRIEGDLRPTTFRKIQKVRAERRSQGGSATCYDEARDFVSAKIRKLLAEGKPHKQAIAIALSMARKKFPGQVPEKEAETMKMLGEAPRYTERAGKARRYAGRTIKVGAQVRILFNPHSSDQGGTGVVTAEIPNGQFMVRWLGSDGKVMVRPFAHFNLEAFGERGTKTVRFDDGSLFGERRTKPGAAFERSTRYSDLWKSVEERGRAARFQNAVRTYARDVRPTEVFGYPLDPVTLTPIRELVDLSPGDYGYDLIGEGPPYSMARMVPSGEVVPLAEAVRRMKIREQRSDLRPRGAHRYADATAPGLARGALRRYQMADPVGKAVVEVLRNFEGGIATLDELVGGVARETGINLQVVREVVRRLVSEGVLQEKDGFIELRPGLLGRIVHGIFATEARGRALGFRGMSSNEKIPMRRRYAFDPVAHEILMDAYDRAVRAAKEAEREWQELSDEAHMTRDPKEKAWFQREADQAMARFDRLRQEQSDAWARSRL